MASPVPSHRHTGHFSGSLHCTAIRHGWTRSFSITREEIDDLDYGSLSRILDLHTLKLRSNNLRIFVENPPNSGTFAKVREWRDDGSLQSVLVKRFFVDRYEEDAVMRFEIRDGRERALDSDGELGSDGHGVFRGHRNRSVFSLNWLGGRRTPRTQGSMDSDPGHQTETAGGLSRFFTFLFAPRPKRAKPFSQRGEGDETTPLQFETQDSGVETDTPPANERSRLLKASNKSSLRQKLWYAAHNHGPFFSSGGPRRSVGHAQPSRKDAGFNSDLGISTITSSRISRRPSAQQTPVEEVSMWEEESTAAADTAGREAPPGLITAFWRSFWAPARPTSHAIDPETAHASAKAPQKMKRMSKPTRRKSSRGATDQHFKGASVIRRPEDAFPRRPDSAVSGLFDDEDPFRG